MLIQDYAQVCCSLIYDNVTEADLEPGPPLCLDYCTKFSLQGVSATVRHQNAVSPGREAGTKWPVALMEGPSPTVALLIL